MACTTISALILIHIIDYIDVVVVRSERFPTVVKVRYLLDVLLLADSRKLIVIRRLGPLPLEELLLLVLLLKNLVRIDRVRFGLGGLPLHGSDLDFLVSHLGQLSILLRLQVQVDTVVYNRVQLPVVVVELAQLLRLRRAKRSFNAFREKVTFWNDGRPILRQRDRRVLKGVPYPGRPRCLNQTDFVDIHDGPSSRLRVLLTILTIIVIKVLPIHI